MLHIDIHEQPEGWAYRVYTDDQRYNIEQPFKPGVGGKQPMTEAEATAFAQADAALIQAQLDAEAGAINE